MPVQAVIYCPRGGLDQCRGRRRAEDARRGRTRKFWKDAVATAGRARRRPGPPHVAGGKSPADAQRRAGHSAAGPSRLQLLERMPARRRPRRRRHGLSPGHRHGGDVGHAAGSSGTPTSSPPKPARSTTITRAKHDGDSAQVRRPHVLDAEHQHLPRPALGPRPGNLRRRPVSHRAPRRRVHPRIAGRRSRITSWRWPARNISPSTAGRNRSAIASTPTRRSAIFTKPICRSSRPPCAKATSARVMGAYNSVYGVPACASSFLLDRSAAQAMGL